MKISFVHRLAILTLALVFDAEAFDIERMPVRHTGARTIVTNVDGDATADVVVQDGFTLTFYLTAPESRQTTLTLPENSSAFDIVDSDGARVLLVVTGDKMLQYALPPSAGGDFPAVIFERPNRLAASSSQPFPYILVVPYEGRTAIALPREKVLEFWSLSGKRLATVPLDTMVGQRSDSNSIFTTWQPSPARLGAEGALEFRVTSTLDASADLLAKVPSLRNAATFLYSEDDTRRALDALNQGPVVWPWFPLRSNDESATRVLYAIAPRADTVIRLRTPNESDSGSETEPYAMPQRRYPGLPLFSGMHVPDFDADGYADLLLWKSPVPGTSLDSMTRIVQGGTWPVQLTVHLFSQELGLYEPSPAGKVESRLPIAWFLEQERGSPLRHVVLRDLSGDGRDDIAFSPKPDLFALWVYDEGFASRPDYVARIDSEIRGIERVAQLNRRGKFSVILRTDDAFYLLSIP